MQTFLPYPQFQRVASCLDYKRLGKQRVEAMQIHNVVSGKRTTGGWVHHPAVEMWQGYPDALALYHDVMLDEWVRRGYANTMTHLLQATWHFISYEMPPWLGDERLHSSHRSNLLRKDWEFYHWYGWTEPQDMPYFWPPREVLYG